MNKQVHQGGRSMAGLLILALICVLVLTGLGFWQLQRLAWKEDLIASYAKFSKQEPRRLQDILTASDPDHRLKFRRVRVSGVWVRDKTGNIKEFHVFSRSGKIPGWQIVSPLKTEQQYLVLVDRGFVPDEFLAREKRKSPDDAVDLVGWLDPHFSAKGLFDHNNDPAKNVWYWWAIDEMLAQIPDREGLFLAHVIIHAEPVDSSEPWPRRSSPDPSSVPNNHFGYALTWFALAIVLLLMTIFLYRSRTRTHQD